jgi:hypothetical protein
MSPPGGWIKDPVPSLSDLPPRKDEPVDRWLARGGIAVGVALYLLPKTPAVVVICLALVFGLLFRPLWNFRWIDQRMWRRELGIIGLITVLVLLGKASWPEPIRTQVSTQDVPSRHPEPDGKGGQPRDRGVARLPAPLPSERLRSKIETTNSEGITLHHKTSSVVGLSITVYQVNSGSLPAVGITRSSLIQIVDIPLTSAEENAFADKVAEVKWNKARSDDEKQPRESFCFSFPDADGDISSIAARAADVIAGKAYLYLFFAEKYRDESLPADKVNVTEYCGWFSGNDLQVRHVCGRNRIFQETMR